MILRQLLSGIRQTLKFIFFKLTYKPPKKEEITWKKICNI